MSKFTKEEYESNDGMVTKMWGPICWSFLHIISFNYPVYPTDIDKINYQNYLEALGKVLPCKYCRDNYKKNLEKTGFGPDIFTNRDTLSRYIYKLHNEVNKMLKKPKYLTYNNIRDRYENFRAHCVDGVPIIPKHDGKEKGCVKPLNGIKSKCVINIIPATVKGDSFKMDPKCILSKSSTYTADNVRKSRSRKSRSRKTRNSRKSKR